METSTAAAAPAPAPAPAGGTSQKKPAAGVACGHSWALLDPAIILEEDKDMAADSSALVCTASDGSKVHVRVSLDLAEPPASSYVKLRTDADVHVKPALLSADGDMLIMRMVVARALDPPLTLYEDNYFVYQARPAAAPDLGKKGRLRLLPDPQQFTDVQFTDVLSEKEKKQFTEEGHAYFGHIGIACRSSHYSGDLHDEWVVAGFHTRVEFGSGNDADKEVGILSRFRSSSTKWEKLVGLSIPFNSKEGLYKFVWHSDDVVAFNGLIFWIDYHRGMIYCDVFAKSPKLHYIPFRGIDIWDQDHDYFNGRQVPQAYRTVAVSRGQLKFVNIDHGSFGTSGFKITTWLLKKTEKDLEWEWVEDHVLVVDQLWELPDFQESHLLRPVLEYPVVDKKNTSILHFILRGCLQFDTHTQAWIITLDMMSNKVLKSCKDPSVHTTQIFCHTQLIPCDFDHLTKHTGSCADTVQVNCETTLLSTPERKKRKSPSPAEDSLKVSDTPDSDSIVGSTDKSDRSKKFKRDINSAARLEDPNQTSLHRPMTKKEPQGWFDLSKKGKLVLREAADLPRDWGVSNADLPRLRSVVLTLDELRQITNNFSDDQLIGEGAFGKVYKGVLTNGDTIAVKRFASTIRDVQYEIEAQHLRDVQYEIEAQHLMRLKHPNIVQLVGYCSETEVEIVWYNGSFVRAEKPERLLCLEYMPKGSLRGHLSDETSGLEWNTRYKIIEGICFGLHYLHEWEATPIIHMDLKPANILLDDNMVPKIADFGLSRLFGEEQTRTCTTSHKGTPGYMAPEYLEKGVITKKFDIFSLGVIIIEIITGLKDYPTDETETTSQQYINLVLNKWRHRLVTKAEAYTSQDIDYQQIKKCIQIGLLCVKFDRVKRPTINQIILMLGGLDEAYQNEREEEAQQWFDSWKSTVRQDLFPEVPPDAHSRTSFQKFNVEELRSRLSSLERMNSRDFENGELPDSKGMSIVSFAGPGRKFQQGWKEISIKGMRAVADPSPQPPGPGQQQQRYVGFKKTLELDDDGYGNKWRAHEYTPLLPSDDDSNKLVSADISLRVEFKENDLPSSSSFTKCSRSRALKDGPETPVKSPVWKSSTTKRSRSGVPKDGPKSPMKSPVWEHMTRVHVKKASNADGSQRKKPCYKVMYAICHHCDKVFNAPSINGTSHLSKHLRISAP